MKVILSKVEFIAEFVLFIRYLAHFVSSSCFHPPAIILQVSAIVHTRIMGLVIPIAVVIEVVGLVIVTALPITV